MTNEKLSMATASYDDIYSSESTTTEPESEYDPLTSIIAVLSANISATEDPSVNYTGVTGSNIQFTLYDILIPTFGIIILLLNLAVIISSGLILKRGVQPRTTYLFLGNVAMADLVTSIAMLFGQLYPRQQRNEVICILQMGMIVSSTMASIWSILLIAVDRFFYIVHALKYQLWLNPCKARWLILSTWILGIIIGFMPATGWIGWTNGGKYCWFIRLAPHGLVLLTGAVGTLPIIIITILYSVILHRALKKVSQLQRADQEASVRHVPKQDDNPRQMRIFRGGQSVNHHNQESTKRSSPKKFRAIMVVVLTAGAFILTWIPYFIASTMHVFCEKNTTDEEKCKPLRLAIASPLAILGFFNSLLNPMIYAWWHKGFRTFVCTKILCRKKKQNSSSNTSNKSNRKTISSNASTKTTKSLTSSSNESRPTSQRVSVGVTEGPYIGENEDTKL